MHHTHIEPLEGSVMLDIDDIVNGIQTDGIVALGTVECGDEDYTTTYIALRNGDLYTSVSVIQTPSGGYGDQLASYGSVGEAVADLLGDAEWIPAAEFKREFPEEVRSRFRNAPADQRQNILDQIQVSGPAPSLFSNHTPERFIGVTAWQTDRVVHLDEGDDVAAAPLGVVGKLASNNGVFELVYQDEQSMYRLRGDCHDGSADDCHCLYGIVSLVPGWGVTAICGWCANLL
jgi:hypothetical protein